MVINNSIKLKDGREIPYEVYEGENLLGSIEQILEINDIHSNVYYLYCYGMWYACGFDGWRTFMIGKNEVHFINMEGHWVKKKLYEGLVRLEHFPDSFAIPKFMKNGLYNHFQKNNANLKLYWKNGNNLTIFPESEEQKKIISFFLTTFFQNAWFVKNTMQILLNDFFTKKMLVEFESSFEYGVWQVNPFTWKIKTGPLSAPFFATFYDFIEDKPFASFYLNNYGKKRKKGNQNGKNK